MSINPSEPQPIEIERELLERIAYWQERFDGIDASTSAAVELRSRAESDLDPYWLYSEALCSIKGIGQIVSANGDRHDDVIEESGAVSVGFNVAKFGRNGRERWMVSHLFYQTLHPDTVYETQQSINLLPKNAVISVEYIPADDGSPEEIPELHASLDKNAQALALLMRSGGFYELTAAEQQTSLTNAVERATAEAEAVEPFCDKALLAEAEFCYVPAPLGSTERYVKINLDDQLVAGKCLGLSTLTDDQLFFGDKIENSGQLVDADAGLFLVVHPDEFTRACMKLEVDDLVHLPIANQDLAASFIKLYEESDLEE